MKQAAHLETVKKLENAGWEFDHYALANRYCYAGSVSEMKSKNGLDYCRVHIGHCVGHRCYQETIVMRRESRAN